MQIRRWNVLIRIRDWNESRQLLDCCKCFTLSINIGGHQRVEFYRLPGWKYWFGHPHGNASLAHPCIRSPSALDVGNDGAGLRGSWLYDVSPEVNGHASATAEIEKGFKASTFIARRYYATRCSTSDAMTLQELVDLRMEGIKLAGVANAIGLLFLGVVLGSGKAASSIIAVKLCIVIFGAGVTAFSIAYWHMCRWRSRLDEAAALVAKNTDTEEPTVADSLTKAGHSFNQAAIAFLVSRCCLGLGIVVALIAAVLLFQPS
jgi:hypothetical protein